MQPALHRRILSLSCVLASLLAPAGFAHAQTSSSNANAPAVSPAGVTAATHITELPKPVVSAHDALEADNAYIAGAREVDRHNYDAAEKDFARAAHLDPADSDYIRALAFTREAHVTELVREAAVARYDHDPTRAAALLAQARKLDPDNRLIAEHVSSGADVLSPAFDPLKFPAQNIASTLAGPPELAPKSGTRDLNEAGDTLSVIRNVYAAYGLKVQFDTSVSPGRLLNFKLTQATFPEAEHLLNSMTGTFAVAVTPELALIAKDTSENRTRLIPQIEETVYMHGIGNDEMQEMANLARNIFDVKYVTASATGGTILVRADEPTLKLLNAEYADILDGGSDVQLDVNLYEIDTSKSRDYGVETPTSITAFPLAAELESTLAANQATIAEAVANNLLNLNGLSELQTKLAEIGFLYTAGLLNSTQISELTGLLGTIGSYDGIPFLGVAIATGSTTNALLQASDSRMLDALELRASSGQKAQFKDGERYPVITSTYTSGVSSSASSALAGISINGTSAASLLAQYGYGTSVTIPQIQFEDLGLTLTATPIVERNNDVHLALDLKLEALGGTSLNNIPILNNRELTSTVTVPPGKTAMLATAVTSSQLGALTGIPGLNDIPGFSGNDDDTQDSKTELLITITPHVVRNQAMRIASRRLAAPPTHPES